METWVTVLVAFIVAFSTLSATFFQNWYSNKRFKIELGRAIDVESRKRRWEVRSEPLLKLRAELAQMATKLYRLVDAIRLYDIKPVNTARNEELQDTVDGWRDYEKSEDFLRTLSLQYDAELREFVERIESEYLLLGEYSLDYKNLRPENLQEFRERSLKIKTGIAEAQELINRRLEES